MILNIELHTKCQYADCRILFIVMKRVVMLNVVRLSVVAPRLKP